MSKNPGKVVAQYDFMSIFSKAWYKAMVILNIVAAFRTTGIYPLNRHAIHIEDTTAPSTLGQSLLLKRLAYHIYLSTHQFVRTGQSL